MLPVELYRGEEALRIDRAKILRRTWQFIGHAAMAPKPGDYLAEESGRPRRGSKR